MSELQFQSIIEILDWLKGENDEVILVFVVEKLLKFLVRDIECFQDIFVEKLFYLDK